jgi:hypothetical protein
MLTKYVQPSSTKSEMKMKKRQLRSIKIARKLGSKYQKIQ